MGHQIRWAKWWPAGRSISVIVDDVAEIRWDPAIDQLFVPKRSIAVNPHLLQLALSEILAYRQRALKKQKEPQVQEG